MAAEAANAARHNTDSAKALKKPVKTLRPCALALKQDILMTAPF
jgi:hypothetical protein